VKGLLASELYRLGRRVMPYLLVALLAAFIALLYGMLWLAMTVETEQPADEQAEAALRDLLSLSQVLGSGMEFVALVGGVMAVILAASIIGSEYGWGTVRTMLPRAAGRTRFLAAKAVVVAGFVLLLTVVGFVAALASSALVTTLADLERDLGDRFVLEAAAAVGRTAFALLPYAALAFMVTLLTRSSAAGIGLGLGVFFLEGTVGLLLAAAGDAGERATEALISSNAEAVMNANRPEPVADIFSAWRGAAVLLAYTLLFVAIAFWRFRKRDVLSG
jgi:ABC-type transport system involved in multi-copper enzyme maturation permease subunit